MRALLTVYDKRDIDTFARGLAALGWELLSTGGTYETLRNAGLRAQKVEDVTGFPEMLDGRVKTLHPRIHAGILARRDIRAHLEALDHHAIDTIDLVACNLYPFRATVARPGVTFDEALEQIDIGGPTLLRAAAKNHRDVLVVCDPDDYGPVLEALRAGAVDPSFRRRLAWKAFAHVAAYDSAIAEWLWAGEGFPPALTLPLELAQPLRYGENPHQRAAFYVDRSLAAAGKGGIATARQHHGKEMSYNNFLDADAAWNAVNEFSEPTCVIVKHTNPCGVASRDDLVEAYRYAVAADPVSAFGGIVAFNRPVDERLARAIREFRSPVDGQTRMFYEIVIAPGFTDEGLAILRGKSRELRILEAVPLAPGSRALRQVGGGWLVQDADDLGPDDVTWTVVTERPPTDDERRDLAFAWRCVKHVKSNAITIAKDARLLGMGSGQPNRVKSVELALEKAGEAARGAVLASDAFFPFAWNDAVERACRAGITAIIQPGGSVRDQDAIACCNQYGVAMVFTGVRHFRH